MNDRKTWGLGIEHEFLVQHDGVMLSTHALFKHKTRRNQPLVDITVPASPTMKYSTNMRATLFLHALDMIQSTVVDIAVGHGGFAAYEKERLKIARNVMALVITEGESGSGSESEGESEGDSAIDNAIDNKSDGKKGRKEKGKGKTSRRPRRVVTEAVGGGIRTGDRLIVTDTWNRTFFVVSKPAPHEPQLTGRDLVESLIAAAEAFAKAYAKATDITDFDQDVDFVEARSLRYRNATVASVARQVRVAEKHAHEEMAPPRARAFPWSGYVDNGGTQHYAGSYHVWITLPHSVSPESPAIARQALLTKHALVAHLLQWIEPLIRSTYASGDPRALGNGTHFSRASMRAGVNEYSGYGTSPADRIATGAPVTRNITWYASTSNALAGRDPHVATPAEGWGAFAVVDGVRLPYDTCADIPRRPFISGDWLPDDSATSVDLVPVGGPGSGGDIRTVSLCGGLSIPVAQGWSELWVGLPKRKQLELHFVNEKRDVLASMPVDAAAWSVQLEKMRGIEFRAIDNFPSGGIETLVRILVLVAAAADAQAEKQGDALIKNAKILKRLATRRAATSHAWIDAMQAVKKGGCHADVGDAYMRDLWRELEIVKTKATKTKATKTKATKTMATKTKAMTAYPMLVALASQLHHLHSRSSVVLAMDPGRKGAPVPVNYNQQAWEEALLAMSPPAPREEVEKGQSWMFDRKYMEHM
jgi:hypothetical protein